MQERKRLSIDLYFVVKSLFFIMIIGVIFVMSFQAKMPGTTMDEYGYMFFPAKISGWDWTEVMRYHPFYGMGSGLLWTPLFILFKGNSALIYQSILIFNGFLLGVTFLISDACAKLLFPQWNKWLRLFSCMVIALYPAWFFYSQIASSEINLYFLFWLVFFLGIKITQNAKYRHVIMLAILLGFMVLVHLRTILIVAITVLYLLYLVLTKRLEWKKFVLFVIILCGGLIVWKLYKEMYYLNIGELNTINQTNTQFQVLGIIEGLIKNIKLAFERLGSRIYYYLVSGSLCIFCAILFLIKESKDILLKKQSNPIFLFVLSVFLVNVVAFVIQGFGVAARLDVPVYGRYTENMIGPVLLCGLYALQNRKVVRKIAYFHIAAIIAITRSVLYQLLNAQTNIFAIDSAVSFGAFFDIYMNMDNGSIFFALLKVVCVAVFIAVVLVFCEILSNYGKLKKTAFYSLSILLIFGCFWVYLGREAREKFQESRESIYLTYSEIARSIDEIEKSEVIYVREEGDDCGIIKHLQFLIEDKEIVIVDYTDDLYQLKGENALILYNYNGINLENMREDFSEVLEKYPLVFFESN